MRRSWGESGVFLFFAAGLFVVVAGGGPGVCIILTWCFSGAGLGWAWSMFEADLGYIWCRPGVYLVQAWSTFEADLGYFWCRPGAGLR